MEQDSYLAKPVECWTKQGGFLEPPFKGTNKHKIPDLKYSHSISNIKPDKLYDGISKQANSWLLQACDAAYLSVKEGGGPFGAIVVQIDTKSGKIIRYWQTTNKVTELKDPTAHAEVLAIRSACSSLGVFNLAQIHQEEALLNQPNELSHCIIYSSCEPCPMCYSSIFWARIPKLYFAATRFDAEVPGVGFSDAAIYKELETAYDKRQIEVHQCDTPNSLDAFNLWKNSDSEQY